MGGLTMSRKCFKLVCVAVVVAVFAGVGGAVQATVIEADYSTSTINAYNGDVSATDLVNAGRASLASVSDAPNGPYPGYGFSITGVNDGSGLANSANSVWYHPGTNLTFTLNTNPATGGSSTGYDITNVGVFAGWTDFAPFSDQTWDLQVTTTTNPVFTTLRSVNYVPYPDDSNTSATSSKVVLTDSTGKIATGVTAVQFVLYEPTLSGSTKYGTVYKEFDVYGTTTVPEPSTLVLLAAGLVGLLAYAWRKQK